MSIGYAILTDHSLVVCRGWGVLSVAELEAMTSALAADPRFRPTLRGLADLRGVTKIAMGGDDVRMRLRSALDGDARRAVVVSSAEAYGMARMYQLSSQLDAANFRLFADLPEAFAWLGLPHDLPWPPEFPEASFGPD